MIVHTLNMCLSIFVQIFRADELRRFFFYRKCLGTYCRLHCVIWVLSDFISVYSDCSHIEDMHSDAGSLVYERAEKQKAKGRMFETFNPGNLISMHNSTPPIQQLSHFLKFC